MHAFHVSAELEELCGGSQDGDTDDEEIFAELELSLLHLQQTPDSGYRVGGFSLLLPMTFC